MSGGSAGGISRNDGIAASWRRRLASAKHAWRQRAEARAVRASAHPPRAPAEVRLRRSRVEVSIDARLALRAGVRLEDFLRHRLARYAGRLPIPLDDLPVVIDVEGSEPVVRSRAPARPSLTAAYLPAPRHEDEGARLFSALAKREGPYAAREIQDARAEVERLDARVAAAQGRVDATVRELGDDLAAGKVPPARTVAATPEQLGRPPVPSPFPIAGLRLFVVAWVAAEAWFFSAPILRAQEVRLEDLAAAPVPVALSLLFALGASAAVFAFASVALERASDVLDGTDPLRRRPLLAAAGIVAASLAAGIAAAAAAPGELGAHALLAAVPFAGALLLRLAARLAAARALASAAALTWDRALAAELAERARRTELVETTRAELSALEAERAEVRRRLCALERRAVEADRFATARATFEARRLEKLAESLAGALELDRYVFLRLASDAADEALVRPARRRLEPAVDPGRLGMAG